jgi:hypothetical protein
MSMLQTFVGSFAGALPTGLLEGLDAPLGLRWRLAWIPQSRSKGALVR